MRKLGFGLAGVVWTSRRELNLKGNVGEEGDSEETEVLRRAE